MYVYNVLSFTLLSVLHNILWELDHGTHPDTSARRPGSDWCKIIIQTGRSYMEAYQRPSLRQRNIWTLSAHLGDREVPRTSLETASETCSTYEKKATVGMAKFKLG
jgi:hypothetical protein